LLNRMGPEGEWDTSRRQPTKRGEVKKEKKEWVLARGDI